MEGLQEIEKAILQILIAYKVVESSILDENLESLRSDYPNQAINLTSSDIFKRANMHLRKLSMEIKTVLIRSEEERKSYHAIVNTADDYIATEFGSKFSDIELEFIREIFILLADIQQIGTTEIHNNARMLGVDHKQKSINIIDQLAEDRWLIRNARSYFEIGPRSYLEIRPFLETQFAQAGAELSSLPQVLFY